MRNYLDEIVEFICETSFSDLPLEVVTRAKEVLTDTIAVITAGMQEGEVKALIEEIAREPGEATLLGGNKRTATLTAALINGTAGTFLELDEGNQFARGHPAIHIIPSLLAIAEEKGASGKDFLTALVLGYDVCARIGIASKIRMSMHPHGTWGTVGAAVSIAKLMGYEKKAMKQVINVSSSLGLATSRRTMLEGGTVRNVYSGVSGYMGVLSHNLIQAGFTGEADGLKTVFGSVISDTFIPEIMTEELGKRFEISRNYFKLHACCRYNHGSLDALEEIIEEKGREKIKPEEIGKIEVETYSLAAQLNDQNPTNMLAAKFSIPFAIATYIVHGVADVDSFKLEAVNNPMVRSLAHKVLVSEDPELTAMMPARRPSRVRVILKNGEKIEKEVFMNKGDFEDPYSPEILEKKYYSLVDTIWGHEKASDVFSLISDLEKIDDIKKVTNLLTDSKVK